MSKHEAIGWVVTVVGVAATIIAIAFFVATTSQFNHREETKRITSCVSHGGTWIDYANLCLQPDTKVVDGETH